MTFATRTLTPLCFAAALVYLLSPMFYTYFQIGYLFNFNASQTVRSVAELPLSVPPLSYWGNLLERYAPQEYPDQSALQSLACKLSAGDKTQKEEVSPNTCRLVMRAGDGVYGPYITLKGGEYLARFTFAAESGCEGGNVELHVTAAGGQYTLAASEQPVRPDEDVALPFTIEGAPRILQHIETTAKVISGCAVLRGLAIVPRAASTAR